MTSAWMQGCPGRRTGSGWSATFQPSLTGLHHYDRISRKKEDEGSMECAVCGGRPTQKDRSAVWAFLLDAEAEQKRIREQAKLLRSMRSGYAK